MEIAKRYDPSTVEDKWYAYWMEHGYFHSEPDERDPFTIVIPPPNVTGVLHMGHMLNNTIQDVLIRRARMQGKNACWVPGTDHASIATEAKVVRKLRDEGVSKWEIGRDAFMEHAWEWKEKHGGIILEQLKKLGASCDWDRTRFTMEPDMSEAVIDTFIDLHKKGLIYRGYRMVNWDPVALTAVSDEEVIHKEVNSKLYHVRYRIEGSDDEWIQIATTRPETILGDTAVCVHPDDPRYAGMKGKRCIIPMVNRSVPIIFDDYIDMEFGTGALKVTPAHDINDYEIGQRHGLEMIDTLDKHGNLSEAAGFYVGEDRFAVRKKIAKDLEESGHLVKVEDIRNKVGYSERTDAVIEPKLSLQWFVKMGEMAKPALEVVKEGKVKLHPQKFVNTYRHWMENVRDWCISRQLWWGQRIPAFFNENDEVVVCKTEEEARKLFEQAGQSTNGIRQDEDVVDTWFSSWLWPISVFDGFKDPDGKDINYYYPTDVLVTAPEILFFWVARMIMAGMEYRQDIPFTDVYLTGIVRDEKRRKMSKSLGNSPDPLELIQKYGADGVRVGMLFSSPAGNDLLFDEGLCEQGRNFSNKIWNAFRLIKGWEVVDAEQPHVNSLALDWMRSELLTTTARIDSDFAQFRVSDALMSTYKLVFDQFCGWFLETIKPEYGQPIDRTTYEGAVNLLEDTLRLLHPFMPFLSEEIWHLIRDRSGDDQALIVSSWSQAGQGDEQLQKEMQHAFETVSAIRNLRSNNGVSPKEAFDLHVLEKLPIREELMDVVKKLANITDVHVIAERQDGLTSFLVGPVEYAMNMGGTVDPEEEQKKLQEELEYTKGFLAGVEKKLGNERFVSGAPEKVVAMEKKKRDDALSKIKSLEERLAVLK